MDTKKEEFNIENERKRIFRTLRFCEIGSQEYFTAIKALHDLEEADKKNRKTLSPDTVLLAAANILGILLILNHERLNVISSKAMSFVLRKPV